MKKKTYTGKDVLEEAYRRVDQEFSKLGYAPGDDARKQLAAILTHFALYKRKSQRASAATSRAGRLAAG